MRPYLLQVLVGYPDYEVTEGRVVFKGQNLLELDPEERSHAGLFMSFQTTIEIPGVSNMDFLLMAANAKRKKHGQPELSPLEVCIAIAHSLLSFQLKIFHFGIVEVWFFHYAPLRADLDLLSSISSSIMSLMDSMN